MPTPDGHFRGTGWTRASEDSWRRVFETARELSEDAPLLPRARACPDCGYTHNLDQDKLLVKDDHDLLRWHT